MKDELFQELVESVKEAGEIRRGAREPARVTEVDPSEIMAFRKAQGLSRHEFAEVLCVTERTLESWEQRRRSPSGPARMLLQVAMRHPKTVIKTARELNRARRRTAR
jgi:putative transcriptional regulator